MGVWRTKNGGHFYIEDEDDVQELTLDEALMERYSYTDVKTLKLSKKEYGSVYHSINNNYYSKHAKSKIITEYVGNYVYTAENHGYNSYRIIRKKKIL